MNVTHVWEIKCIVFAQIFFNVQLKVLLCSQLQFIGYSREHSLLINSVAITDSTVCLYVTLRQK
jgi:hypothetical protein